MRLHYRTITHYRERPPKWRIINPAEAPPPEMPLRQAVTQRLYNIDRLLTAGYDGYASPTPGNVLGFVFANQLRQHASGSYLLASLLEERKRVSQRQLKDLDAQLATFRERRPLRLMGPSGPSDVGQLSPLDRQILDLERQKRQVEVDLWRDTMQLRQLLLNERREYQSTRSRMRYLGGGDGGAG